MHSHDQRPAADLINEPRCDMPNCKGNVQNWIQTQSAYLKSIDSNHLVTVGVPCLSSCHAVPITAMLLVHATPAHVSPVQHAPTMAQA